MSTPNCADSGDVVEPRPRKQRMLGLHGRHGRRNAVIRPRSTSKTTNTQTIRRMSLFRKASDLELYHENNLLIFIFSPNNAVPSTYSHVNGSFAEEFSQTELYESFAKEYFEYCRAKHEEQKNEHAGTGDQGSLEVPKENEDSALIGVRDDEVMADVLEELDDENSIVVELSVAPPGDQDFPVLVETAQGGPSAPVKKANAARPFGASASTIQQNRKQNVGQSGTPRPAANRGNVGKALKTVELGITGPSPAKIIRLDPAKVPRAAPVESVALTAEMTRQDMNTMGSRQLLSQGGLAQVANLPSNSKILKIIRITPAAFKDLQTIADKSTHT